MSYVDAALAPQRKTGQIKLHGAAAFAGMRKAGQLAAECLDMLADEVEPGVTTEQIDQLVFEFAMDRKAMPATLLYRGYRKSTCTSVNHVVCHGIPDDKPLQGRRHRQCRRHRDRRRLARRHQPHVSRSARSRAGPSG